jgi:hypothetical protein
MTGEAHCHQLQPMFQIVSEIHGQDRKEACEGLQKSSTTIGIQLV